MNRAPTEPSHPHNDTVHDAVIVGAGPIGIACGVAARKRGWDPLLIDAGPIANSLVRYPTQMVFFTTPELLEVGGHPFPCHGAKPTRAEALKYYRGVVRNAQLRVRTYCRLLAAQRQEGHIELEVESDEAPQRLLCRRLVIATGYFDHANLLEVPGEELPHVTHYYDEGHLWYGRNVVVIGGKNSAVETALDLFRSGANVTLVYRRQEFRPSVKYWLLPDLQNRVKAGEINAHLGTEVLEIFPKHVVVRTDSGEVLNLPADRVYALTGYHPDEELFQRVGIRVDPATGRPEHDPETLESNVSGIFLAGSVTTGRNTSDVFIENGRFDGEKIFTTPPREDVS